MTLGQGPSRRHLHTHLFESACTLAFAGDLKYSPNFFHARIVFYLLYLPQPPLFLGFDVSCVILIPYRTIGTWTGRRRTPLFRPWRWTSSPLLFATRWPSVRNRCVLYARNEAISGFPPPVYVYHSTIKQQQQQPRLKIVDKTCRLRTLPLPTRSVAPRHASFVVCFPSLHARCCWSFHPRPCHPRPWHGTARPHTPQPGPLPPSRASGRTNKISRTAAK